PVRVKVDGAPGGQTSLRFVGMASLVSGLDGLNLSLAKGGVPEAINLGANYETEPVREAVRYLLGYLNEPPLRRSKRRGIRVDLNVLNGFERVLQHSEVGQNFSEAPSAHWSVEDISSTGFQAVSPVPGSDAIRIGSLLGMQPDGVAHWGVAVVRRLMRDDAGQLHVGAEMLSSRIGGVVLQPSGASGADDGQAALWLYADACGADDGEVCLLMKADTFSGKRSLQTRLGDRRYLLIPGGLREKGRDYDLARFRAIEQEAGED
ncbi:MAG TPA: hypothetical protein VFW53_01285, partial [Gallionella sp.]|nr:hypothetical protein [Gallionella sp.]